MAPLTRSVQLLRGDEKSALRGFWHFWQLWHRLATDGPGRSRATA
jgi:hypothetical protein